MWENERRKEKLWGLTQRSGVVVLCLDGGGFSCFGSGIRGNTRIESCVVSFLVMHFLRDQTGLIRSNYFYIVGIMVLCDRFGL